VKAIGTCIDTVGEVFAFSFLSLVGYGWFGERNPTVCDWALFDQESGLPFIVGAGTSRITRHTYQDKILNRLDTVM
jgi:hypothetical protein